MYQYTNLNSVTDFGSRNMNGMNLKGQVKKGVFVRILGALIGCALFVPAANAQKRDKVSRYETFIYTNDNLDELIKREYVKQQEETRGERSVGGYFGALGDAMLNQAKGIAGGYVTSVIDIGVNAIAALITQNANNKVKWEAIVKSENSYQETLSTVEPINNFYASPSFDGPMDPAGMKFDGIGCLRTIEGDTVLFISCRIDTSKIFRITNHSKFELSLDTLIINPFQCDLPNSNFDTEFSFERRTNFQLEIEMCITSSWINELTFLNKNQELGSFVISVPVNQNELQDGKLRYVRTADEPAKFNVVGESFIIPRSYMGYRDSENKYGIIWGTGAYKIDIVMKQTCSITSNYRNGWKADWNLRQKADSSEDFVQRSWTMISSQRWDEITKRWVITTLKAPAAMINSDLLKELKLTKK